MEHEKEKKILSEIGMFDKKSIVIRETGFINSKFIINCLKYKIEYDILELADTKQEQYITINLNQIYKYEIKNKKIKIYLDNDTEIEIYII